MGFVEAVKTCLGKYARFSGRATRPEYWWFALFVLIGSLVLTAADYLIFGFDRRTFESYGYLDEAFGLLVFLPALGATVRRLHDTGRSGWRLLVLFLVAIALIMLVDSLTERYLPAESLVRPIAQLVLWVGFLATQAWWLTRPSQPGDNAYGPPAA